jgi:8-oxo-dGTP pyrophosphatase MutT (NUDIX family)
MIYFGNDRERFLLRAAAVVRHNGRVLLQRIGEHDFWCLPGGRLEMGESAVDGLAREMVEECGHEAEIGRLIWIIENFYTHQGVREHEVGLYFDVQFDGESAVYQEEWHSAELEGTPLLFRWFDASDLERVNLKPQPLRGILADPPDRTTHIVHVE